jgi:hypothetical protein
MFYTISVPATLLLGTKNISYPPLPLSPRGVNEYGMSAGFVVIAPCIRFQIPMRLLNYSKSKL